MIFSQKNINYGEKIDETITEMKIYGAMHIS